MIRHFGDILMANAKVNSNDNDEIDLLELLKILWEGKWIIFLFMLIGLLFGIGIQLLNKPEYRTTLEIKIDVLPPFYSDSEVILDFQKHFYNPIIFMDWKNNAKGTILDYKDLDITKLINGFKILKDKEENLVTLIANYKNQKTTNYYLDTKTNSLQLLFDVFEYSNYVSALLEKDYFVRAKKELGILKNNVKNIGDNQNVILQLLSIDRYLAQVEKGRKVLLIQHPKLPKKISVGYGVTIPLYIIIGMILGFFYILLRNFIRKHINNKVKS